jgi:ferredoxin
MDRGVPVVDYAKCTSCGTCVSKCPAKVLALVQAGVFAPAVEAVPVEAGA